MIRLTWERYFYLILFTSRLFLILAYNLEHRGRWLFLLPFLINNESWLRCGFGSALYLFSQQQINFIFRFHQKQWILYESYKWNDLLPVHNQPLYPMRKVSREAGRISALSATPDFTPQVCATKYLSQDRGPTPGVSREHLNDVCWKHLEINCKVPLFLGFPVMPNWYVSLNLVFMKLWKYLSADFISPTFMMIICLSQALNMIHSFSSWRKYLTPWNSRF